MKKLILLIILLLTSCGSPQRPSLIATVQAGGSIQTALNAAKAGDEIVVKAGTYNEALTLPSGKATAAQRITLRCETARGCTVNSGNARTLVTQGQNGYWIIDGFRLLSTRPEIGEHPSYGASVNFSYNEWWDGFRGERGNDGFILRNCYVEGTVWIYGSDSIVENCEFNGRGQYSNAITEAYAPSENNTFRNNIIHDYQIRGGWSLQLTRNTQWINNTIYNIRYPPNHDWNQGIAIDCDGAGSAVYKCDVKNNTIYNASEAAILLENTFDSVIENNVIRDSARGISAINYNKVNNDGFTSDADYKGLMTNTIIQNNIIDNISHDGVLCKAVRGNQLLNNTISNVDTVQGYFGAIAFATYSAGCPDWIVTGNTVTNSPKTVWLEGNPPITMNYNFYDNQFTVNLFPNGDRTFAQWQALGHDASSAGNLLFSDEFNGTTLDTSKWTAANKNGYGQELFRPSNVTISNGVLHLVANSDLTSGEVKSAFSFTYGYIESSIRVPKGNGFWPAFWLLTNFDNTSPFSRQEIDIMESKGDDIHTSDFNVHWGVSGNSPSAHSEFTNPNVDYSAAFHKYAVNWAPTKIEFFIDDILHWTWLQPSQPLVYDTSKILLSLSLCAANSFCPAPDTTTIFPSEMLVDYVRVYSSRPVVQTSTNTPTLSPSVTPMSTNTATSTVFASQTHSATPSPPTATITPSITLLPTFTPSRTPTATPTVTRTPTQTITPTRTPVPTTTPKCKQVFNTPAWVCDKKPRP